MERLIPVINKLQDVFHSVGMLDTIDLPQIAVVGSQSSGKSSVLENIVGRDFLPRGTGIVTRRPVVLQLIHTPKPQEAEKNQKQTEDDTNSTNPYEWGEFLHLPNQKFHDFNEIRNEINRETDRVTGKNKGISALPIHIKIFSPYVLNLTMIDLPGITKVPVGDQPKDIEYQIRKMVLQFISKPNCIILAVTAANTDIANSDALKIAREVDPKGDRTIGVLTKLDIMDQGTDAMDVLTGQVIQLRRGFIAVVNRGQNDINNNKSIRAARQDEMLYFQRHQAYKSIADRLGTAYLARTLNHILLSHIRETLPEIKNKITALIIQAQQRLNDFGVPLTESAMSPGAMLLQLLTRFATDYVDAIDGRNTDMGTNELFGGARINHIFVKKFTPHLLKMDACENLTEHDIRTAIRNAKGPRTSLFIPEASFEMLVKRQVKMLEDPSLHCVDQVFEELKSIVDHCERALVRFPNLRDRVKEYVVALLRNYSTPLKEFIKNVVNIELAYVNTNHPDFFSGGQSAILLLEKIKMHNAQQQQAQMPPVQSPTVQQGNQQVRPGTLPGKPPAGGAPMQPQPQEIVPQYNPAPPSMADRESTEIFIIRELLREYFSIVRKSVSDSVPKAVMFFLVNKSKLDMQSELVKAMYKEELFEDLLKENDDVANKRKATQKMLSVLQAAQDVINEVRDIRL